MTPTASPAPPPAPTTVSLVLLATPGTPTATVSPATPHARPAQLPTPMSVCPAMELLSLLTARAHNVHQHPTVSPALPPRPQSALPAIMDSISTLHRESAWEDALLTASLALRLLSAPAVLLAMLGTLVEFVSPVSATASNVLAPIPMSAWAVALDSTSVPMSATNAPRDARNAAPPKHARLASPDSLLLRNSSAQLNAHGHAPLVRPSPPLPAQLAWLAMN